MGRYYSGDIDGKFMFGIQPSDAPERFHAVDLGNSGIYGETEYYIGYDYRHKVKKEVESIDKGSLERVNKMYNENDMFTEDTMKIYGVTTNDLREYADHRLGMQILEHFKENKCDCYIYAEL